MLESAIEKCLVRLVEGAGGITIKLHKRGWPDRLVILPGDVKALVELKRPKKSALSPMQRSVHARLAKLGTKVHVPRSIDDVVTLVLTLKGDGDAIRIREAEARDAGRGARKVNDRHSSERGQGIC